MFASRLTPADPAAVDCDDRGRDRVGGGGGIEEYVKNQGSPATPIRHFTSFPSSPEDEIFVTPAQYQFNPAHQSQTDDTEQFTQAHQFSTTKPKPKPQPADTSIQRTKRRSFMPGLDELKISEGFAKQIAHLVEPKPESAETAVSAKESVNKEEASPNKQESSKK